jgi:hypothetical protein
MKMNRSLTGTLGPKDAQRFKKAAAKFTKQVTRSPATAQKALEKAGILTKAGKLAKSYR